MIVMEKEEILNNQYFQKSRRTVGITKSSSAILENSTLPREFLNPLRAQWTLGTRLE